MLTIDRLVTVAVTAAVTSAGWFLAGQGVFTPTRGAGDSAIPAVPTPQPGGEVAPPVAAPDTNPLPAAREPGALILPVEGVRKSALTDTFADQREGGLRFHEAIDIMAPRGTTVLSASPGTIEKIYSSDAGGKTIYIRSSDRTLLYYYAHLDGYAPGLREGARVAAGDPLGTVGSTGNASEDAPHLHFAMLETTADAQWWEPANAINPYPLLVRP